METKSRYEVIADLEEKKRALIVERDGFTQRIQQQAKHIKDIKRQLEDREEELEEFKASKDEREATINELIKSLDDTLAKFKQ